MSICYYQTILKGTDEMWKDTLERSVLQKLEDDGLIKKSYSSDNVCKLCDAKITTGPYRLHLIKKICNYGKKLVFFQVYVIIYFIVR